MTMAKTFLDFPGAEELDRQTDAAFADPQVGDVFEEICSHWVIVVGRNGARVAWLNIWGGGQEGYVGTLAEFQAMYAYRSIPGYSVKLYRRGKDVAGWMTTEMAAELAPLPSDPAGDRGEPGAAGVSG